MQLQQLETAGDPCVLFLGHYLLSYFPPVRHMGVLANQKAKIDDLGILR